MKEFKIASWNVNSIRARLPIILDWLKKNNFDVVLFQEIKTEEQNFPFQDLESLGYNVILSGQKSYNGVAIISKYIISDVKIKLPTREKDDQARYIEAWINLDDRGIRVASIYAPNGNPIESEKYDYKLSWMKSFYDYARLLSEYEENIILGGDYNICPNLIDVANEEMISKDAVYSQEARKIFKKIKNLNFFDAFRTLNNHDPGFTYWDYGSAFRNDLGVRIDHFLATPQIVDKCNRVWVDKDVRNKPKPSDHAPVCMSIKI